jgi:hypothetical protein
MFCIRSFSFFYLIISNKNKNLLAGHPAEWDRPDKKKMNKYRTECDYFIINISIPNQMTERCVLFIVYPGGKFYGADLFEHKIMECSEAKKFKKFMKNNSDKSFVFHSGEDYETTFADFKIKIIEDEKFIEAIEQIKIHTGRTTSYEFYESICEYVDENDMDEDYVGKPTSSKTGIKKGKSKAKNI